jgi:hypothetical protein
MLLKGMRVYLMGFFLIECIFFTNLFSSAPFAGIIKIPGKDKETVDCYQNLACSEEDKNKIVELITTIGSYGKIDLFMHHEKRMREIEKDIRPIHPMKFLGTIFSKPELKKYMKNIHDDWFKWKYFVDGLSPNMTTETLKRKNYLYLPDFAKEVNCKEYELKVYLDRKDWSGFLEYLIYNT